MDVLDTPAVARLLGVTPATVRSYLARGLMPQPAGRIGASPYWTREAVEAWVASRPGRGVGGGRPRKG
jgi:predicted DNA-binding transcriptional regulator AlpA